MTAGTEPLCGFEQWDAVSYLSHYYARVEADEARTLDFIVRACRRITRSGRALVFGVGPTIHHLLPLAPHVERMHVSDYLDSNLEHVRRWLRRDAGAHDWRPFVRHVLRCEGTAQPSELQVAQREQWVRSRVTACLRADAGCSPPLPQAGHAGYDVLLSCYCAESATGDQAHWRRYMHNIVSLLAPGGLFITAALRRCRAYQVGPRQFPCADIDEHDLTALLRDAGFGAARMQVEVHRVGLRRLGYDGIVLVAASSAPDGAPSVASGARARVTPPRLAPAGVPLVVGDRFSVRRLPGCV